MPCSNQTFDLRLVRAYETIETGRFEAIPVFEKQHYFQLIQKSGSKSYTPPPRNRESVLGRKQGSIAKALDKRKIHKITEHRVIKTIMRVALSL
jgi:hypothetical protein